MNKFFQEMRDKANRISPEIEDEDDYLPFETREEYEFRDRAVGDCVVAFRAHSTRLHEYRNRLAFLIDKAVAARRTWEQKGSPPDPKARRKGESAQAFARRRLSERAP